MPRRSGPPAYATFARIEALKAGKKLLALSAFAAALVQCSPGAHYDYTHLPSGYHWRAVYDPDSNAVVFYGRDPLTSDTVYVGPDSRFYVFPHRGHIQRRDLQRHWGPHDASPL